MTTDYLIGIDGGGSKTVALLATSTGRLLGRGTAGPGNYHAAGAAAVCAALDKAIAGAFGDAGLLMQEVRALVVGLAGVDRPADRAVFETWLAERRLAQRALLTNDALMVLSAGTPDSWGLALICGTGSIVYGRDAGGRLARAGGWGYLLGDEGSGYAIGLSALRAVARAADGRDPSTSLTGLILEHWALSKPEDLIAQVYRAEIGRPEIAALAPVVDRCAANGDAVADAILHEAGRELALAASTVARGLSLTNPVPCALAGSLLLRSDRLARYLLAAAEQDGLVLSPLASVSEPALGAVRMAREL